MTAAETGQKPGMILAAMSLALLTTFAVSITSPAAAQDSSPLSATPPPQPTGGLGDCGDTCGDARVEGDNLIAEVSEFVEGGEGARRISTGSSYFDGCVWDRVTAGDPLTVRPGSGFANLEGTVFTVDHWVIYCGPGLAGYTLYPVGTPPPAPVVADLINDAYAQTPVVAFNPITSPDGDIDNYLIAQATTYLWVDDTTWNTPVSATASVPGFSVTTQAQADFAYWTGGDKPARCHGPDMIPYDFSRDEDNQRSRCSMVYKHASATHDNEVNLDVTWTVTYTCSIPICGGSLPDIITRSTRPVLVGEILAVLRRHNPSP